MNKQPSTEIFSSRQFPQWLAQQNLSIALTTYQTGQLFFLGGNESGELQGFQRLYDRAMGLYATPERIYLSCKYQLWQLDNILTPGQLHQGYDKLYIPRIGYTTGDLDIHDVTVDRDGRIIFVSTMLNCLATVSDHKSCKPLWKPSFISRIINEDRCHLNGLAMVDGEPGFVSACSQSDLVDGWRDHAKGMPLRDRRLDGGIVIDVASNEIICKGLSMPHSPRWYQNKLWLHNSGRGELGYVDLQTGKFEPVAFCPGYLRGLAFWGNYAIVGLSKPRNGDKTFSGLPLDDLLHQKDGEARCGLMVVDLNTGAIAHWLRLEGKITELYDVQVIPNVKRPMALGFQTEEIAQLISLEPLEEVSTKNTLLTTEKPRGEENNDIIKLQNNRQQLARQWLNLPLAQLENAYAGDIGQAHREIINSNLKYELLSSEEKNLVEELISSLIQNPQQIQYLLAVMLYRLPHQLPSEWFSTLSIPAWLTNDYLWYMSRSPALFQEKGEADSYYYYLASWFAFIQRKINQYSNSALGKNLAWFFAKHTAFLPVYFTEFNLKDIFVNWSNITESAFLDQGFSIDHRFPPRSKQRTKIRLGILNKHFKPHTEIFITLPIFEYLDRDLFEIILYAGTINNHPLEKYCQSRSDRLVKLPQDLSQAVHTIRSDDLDILFIGTNISTGSHPTSQLGMHRLARIQLTSFSSPVTTGMKNIDYYLYGSLTESKEEIQQQHREKVITVAGSGYCFTHKYISDEKSQDKLTRADWNLTEEQVIFISGANFYKIIPELRETWVKILASVPNSVLVLYPFSGWGNSYPVESFLQQISTVFAKHEIDKSRLIVLPVLAGREVVKEHLRLADVYLDAYPYTGATSIIDPLEVGLPPLVRSGNSVRSGQAAAILREIGMNGIIAESETEYLNLAISLGNNPELRNSYRQEIEEKIANNPPFLNSKNYSAKIGKLFQKLFQTWSENNHETNLSLPSSLVNKTNTPQELFNHSRLLKKQGNLAQAETFLRQSINLKPDYWIAYNNLGTLLQSQGNITEAKQCYQKTLQFNPNLAEAISNLASIWQLEEDLEKAKTGYCRALQLKPDYVPAHFNLANIFKEQKRLGAAVEHYQKVVYLQPDYTEAHISLGHIFEYHNQLQEALNCYQKAQKTNPNATHLDFNIAMVQLRLGNWQNYETRLKQLLQSLENYLEKNSASGLSPFALSALPVSLSHHQAAAKSQAQSITKQVAKLKDNLNFNHSKSQPQKLRIGYISPDFRNHAVGRLIYQIFSHHDRSQFEIYCYTTVDVDDHITKEIRSGCDVFVDLSPLSTAAAARRIYSDSIHILIDLAGYTIGNGVKILALQPAPIQAQWLGYPDTMGAEFMQYYLGDRTLITPEIAQHYTEEIIYLPHTFVASPLEISDKVMTRSEFDLPDDAFVFCCFNSHYKITPEVFDVWMGILQQVPNSVLWLTSGQGKDNLCSEAKQRGIEANRLVFADKIPHDEYLARYSLADLYLDTFIYNAGSTAAAVLWTGLPLLTHPGNTNASRMGASICAAAGLESMICETVGEYEQKAVHLATNPQELAQIRQELQNKLQSETTYPPLFQVENFVRSLENGFQQMWEKFCEE